MIESVSIKNFKCFKDFAIDLDPFTVLIGPNDTGKTAFLEALRVGTFHAPGITIRAEEISRVPVGPETVWRGAPEGQITISIFPSSTSESGSQHVFLMLRSGPQGVFQFTMQVRPDAPANWRNTTPLDAGWEEELYSRTIGQVKYFRFDPAALKSPGYLDVPMQDDGRGFAPFLDEMLRMDRETFSAMEQEFYRWFPHYQGLQIKKVTGGGNPQLGLRFRTKQGQYLPAHSVSDGVFLSLAFIGLTYLSDPAHILLIEEPENGVHHASLKEIVTTLRNLRKVQDVQVILTTHSPYLLDLVEPEEVRLFRKDAEGAVHAVKMSDLPDVQDMQKHFMTGEIWTGLDEADAVAKVRGKK